MFGYIKTDLPNMYMKDTVLYQAMYCGLCKAIGKTCGQRARFALNYDLTFLSVLLHNLQGVDVKVEKQHCIIHPIRKRPITLVDELTERIGCLNVILAYQKLNDDVIDNGKGRIERAFFSSAYKKAKKKEPEIDAIVKNRYSELLKLESENCDSIDIVADPFGKMIQDIVAFILKDNATEDVKELAYYLGKWIYLIDALDDFNKDKKKKNFNVFINLFPTIADKEQLIRDEKQELTIVFASVLNRLSELAGKMNYKFNHDLINNVLYRGLPLQTKKIMENEKCKNTSKF